jgi:hypothetical protein
VKLNMMLKALIALAIAAAVAEASVHVASTATDCSGQLAATVTFVTSCTTVSSTDAACWTPHAPGATDVVLFPGGTSASVAFETLFTPLSVRSILIAGGAKITMNGGALVVSECLQLAGTLLLDTAGHLDNGTASTMTYPHDPSVPMGTDCAAVPRGFSPRVCGPGSVYVSGTLTLQGLYASLWAQTTVSSSASLSFNDESFLWGNVTNLGSVSANKRFFFHGALTNQPGANAQFSELRADFWTVDPGHASASLTVMNYGSMTFTLPKSYDSNYEFVSTKDCNGTAFVALHIQNHADLLFYSWLRGPYSWSNTWGQLAMDVTNFGTTTWRGNQDYLGIGTVNNYGAFVADASQVSFSQYTSHGGTEVTLNGGSFGMGVSAAMEAKLKSKGILGPYLTGVSLRNNHMSSPDGTGHFYLNAPARVDGIVSVEAGATLHNNIPFRAPSVMQAASSGVLRVAGGLVAGVHDAMQTPAARGAQGGAGVVFTRTGTLNVPKGSVVTLNEEANIRFESGSLLRAEGRVMTRSAASNTTVRRLDIHPHAFGLGPENVDGDFNLQDRLVFLD